MSYSPSGGSGAPTDATYITQTANASLSAEQALSSLTTGVVKVTNGTGVLSTAVAGTDYAAASHTHAAADIASGTIATARLGSGTANSSSYLRGDQTWQAISSHAQSHAITSTSDHTANNWKVWYSNGSGQVVELALGANGTVLTSAGASSAPTFSSPSGPWTLLKQTADESKANNTLTASTYMTVALNAATHYTVRGVAYLLVQDAAADARFDINYSGTWTTVYCVDKRNIAGVAAGTDNQTVRIASALPTSTDVLATVTGLVVVEFELNGLTNAGGTLAFRFAQVANSATTTLLKRGSYMEYMSA